MERLPAAAPPVVAHFRSARPIIGHTVRQSLAAIVMLAALSATAWCADGAGTIKTLSGSATVLGASSALRLPIAEGQRVYAGDRIASGPGSYVGIMLNDDTRLTIGPRSELVIREFEFTPGANTGGFWVAFLKGTAKVVTGFLATYAPERVLFTTPSGKIGVRGTEFVLDLEPE
jgi:hypothetical protein